ncbi:hypothetical protein [Salidesulfovibrio onnuriiensis]|uniref:hypothetical protein n=1 Tax=Salidesulfovibrio onnuriiensis TaxID=2583823 RepID=UPI0011C889D6|nr:hypothetical protein [Salidesulfovibrio onnuriiensis]
MPLTDYQEIATKLQKALGHAFAEEPWLLNLPGKSIACKIDQYYYVAVMPAFVDQLSEWAGVSRGRAAEALVKTGNLITKAPERNPMLRLGLVWDGQTYDLKAAFVDADFIDRALRFYGGLESVLNVSELKLSEASRDRVEELFENKTAPQALAYG